MAYRHHPDALPSTHLSVLTEIRNRGLTHAATALQTHPNRISQDALIVCCDGLRGQPPCRESTAPRPDAIEATWPHGLRWCRPVSST